MLRIGTAVDHGRDEEPRVAVAHGLGGREGPEVGGALLVAARADRAGERAEDARADEHREQHAGEQDEGLAGLAASHRAASGTGSAPGSPRPATARERA